MTEKQSAYRAGDQIKIPTSGYSIHPTVRALCNENSALTKLLTDSFTILHSSMQFCPTVTKTNLQIFSVTKENFIKFK